MKRLLMTCVLALAAVALTGEPAMAGCKAYLGFNFGIGFEFRRDNNCCPPPCCVDGCGTPVGIYEGTLLPPQAGLQPYGPGPGLERKMPGSGEPSQLPPGTQKDAQQIGYFESNGYDQGQAYDANQYGANYQGYNWQDYGYQVPSYWYGR